ncbi:hypothetical protein CQY20_10290 [Mycolicibacterium agri]|uniref:Arsenate reductase n=1 Tax=Mycolicibacterium agri TaxID=36811 RepID=A0A2A7N6V6_MYCAG|nr:hypothetical protein [Mycolicibacterium agri]PEG39569.1 hypothetical protein CQY20_10290 [Mycolicibacterium agri]GFG48590.1 hypothetical protein MAGR_00310 [Mycolicibacterium agri]
MATDEAADWATASCSLPIGEQPLRIAEFDRLFAGSARRSVRVSPTRLDVSLAASAEAAACDLAAREVQCCSFFNFEFTSADSAVVMSIEVPQSRIDVLDELTSRVRTVGGQ